MSRRGEPCHGISYQPLSGNYCVHPFFPDASFSHCLSVRLSVIICLFVFQSLSVCLSFSHCLSICLSVIICLFVFQSLSVCLSFSHCLSICLSVIVCLFVFQSLSVQGCTPAFLLNVHSLCGAIEGTLRQFLPRWLRTGWQGVISQGKIP